MTRKPHKVCRHYGPLPAVRPAKSVPAGVGPIAGPPAEQAKKQFTDENWRSGCGASQARRPKRRHIGAVSAIAVAAFDAATTPAARNHLGKQAHALPMRVPSANWVSPTNYFWPASWITGSPSGVAALKSARPLFAVGRRLCRKTELTRDRDGPASRIVTGLSFVLRVSQ
jgi:hypothetical protein